MSILKEIQNNKWTKNWSGHWKTPFASLYFLYTTDLDKYIGRNLSINLLVCEKESSSNYIVKTELDEYCEYMANKISRDSSLAVKWAEDTVVTAKELKRLLKTAEEEVSYQNLLNVKNKFYEHIPPHFGIKKVIDYLPSRLQADLEPTLRSARIETEDLFNEVDRVLCLYAEHIAKEKNYSKKVSCFLTVDEILEFLQTKKAPNEKELSIRSQGIILFCSNQEMKLLSGEDFNQTQKILIGESKEQLKGSAAFLGKAKGVARIIFDPYKVKEFNEGDILITGMTRPEFLPLMKKAGAFVTDAGGMLSHAAIVARELKKPCVLATEVATKIFKDGDIVEVDANNGVVRKID